MATVMTEHATERRRDRRRRHQDDHGISCARLRPGYDVSVIDVSAGGALIESDRRLLPGAAVELNLRGEHRPPEIIRGHVLRAAVARLRSNMVCYRGAIVFDHDLPWLVNEASSGSGLPGSENRPGRTPGATATPQIV